MITRLVCLMVKRYTGIHKIALNREDDKRLVQADGITILARGYVATSA